MDPASMGPVSQERLDEAKIEVQEIIAKTGWRLPVRSHMEDSDIKWRFGGPPDYTLANLEYLKGKTRNHPEGSLELIVENLVKTWEMERSHKTDYLQHQSVDQERFNIGANGGPQYDNKEANRIGNYNVLLATADPKLYNAKEITWK